MLARGLRIATGDRDRGRDRLPAATIAGPDDPARHALVSVSPRAVAGEGLAHGGGGVARGWPRKGSPWRGIELRGGAIAIVARDRPTIAPAIAASYAPLHAPRAAHAPTAAPFMNASLLGGGCVYRRVVR